MRVGKAEPFGSKRGADRDGSADGWEEDITKEMV